MRNKLKKRTIWSLIVGSSIIATSLASCTGVILSNNNHQQITTSQPQGGVQYRVGLMNDGGPNNKRFVIWEGDSIGMKYTSSTQGQMGQYGIWNDWYFQHTKSPTLPIPNEKDYFYYSKWKCTNFWGNRSKNQNRHNIPNEYVIKNASKDDQGFYNFQYNYITGNGSYQHHRFSSYPYQVIVCPTNYDLNIKVDNKLPSDNQYDLGVNPDIDVELSYGDNSHDDKSYIDKNNDLVHVQYMWQYRTSDVWENLTPNWVDKSHLPDFDFKSGTYYFRVKTKLSLTENNNIKKNNKVLEKTSNEIKITIKPKVEITNLNVLFHDDVADLHFNTRLNNKDNFDSNLVKYDWYKRGEKSNSWDLITNETNRFERNHYRVSLEEPASYKMTANSSSIKVNETHSETINVLKPYRFIVNKIKNDKIDLFKFQDKLNPNKLPTYSIYNQNLEQIISDATINSSGKLNSFQLDTSKIDENTNFYLKIFNPMDESTSLCLIKLLPKAISSNNINKNDKGSSISKSVLPKKDTSSSSGELKQVGTLSNKLYKQWWFYLIIILSLIGLGIGGYFLTKFLINKHKLKRIESQENNGQEVVQ